MDEAGLSLSLSSSTCRRGAPCHCQGHVGRRLPSIAVLAPPTWQAQGASSKETPDLVYRHTCAVISGDRHPLFRESGTVPVLCMYYVLLCTLAVGRSVNQQRLSVISLPSRPLKAQSCGTSITWVRFQIRPSPRCTLERERERAPYV